MGARTRVGGGAARWGVVPAIIDSASSRGTKLRRPDGAHDLNVIFGPARLSKGPHTARRGGRPLRALSAFSPRSAGPAVSPLSGGRPGFHGEGARRV